MVGFSVRLRGGGHSMPFRVVGILGTLFGSVLGSVGAAAALTAMEQGTSAAGIIHTLSSLDTVLAAYTGTYSAIDLVSLLFAAYISFRLSASRPG